MECFILYRKYSPIYFLICALKQDPQGKWYPHFNKWEKLRLRKVMARTCPSCPSTLWWSRALSSHLLNLRPVSFPWCHVVSQCTEPSRAQRRRKGTLGGENISKVSEAEMHMWTTQLSCIQKPDPKTKRENIDCCFKPLSFRVIRYTAISNKYNGDTGVPAPQRNGPSWFHLRHILAQRHNKNNRKPGSKSFWK